MRIGDDTALSAYKQRLLEISPLRWVLAGATLAACVSAAVFFYLAREARAQTPLTEVMLLGKPLQLDSQAAKQGLRALRTHVSRLFVIKLPEGQERRVSFGDLGVEIDRGHLVQLLRDAIDRTSPISRVRRRQGLGPETPLVIPAPLSIEPQRVERLLLAIKNEHDRPPVDARLNLKKRQVMPSREGLLLDVDASFEALRTAIVAGRTETELRFERVAPERRTEQLSDVRFDHVMAAFETSYDRSARARARTHNLRVAASKLDGSVLLPGEVFDFNRTVGPRDESNGYKVAPVIAQGELVDGIGGGTCQISGTLNGAAFFGGLDIVERYPHTRPSAYIKLGLDATVVYPTINFRVRNPYDFPIVLHQTVARGVVRAEILGPNKDITTTLIRRIDRATPYEEVERPDPSIPSGSRVLDQRGVPGFHVRVYRITREGPFATRERWINTYPATTQIVRVGTGDKSGKRDAVPQGDPHPEYTADELLVVTHSTQSERDPAQLSERREAGRFGTAGWTKRAGMPVFDVDP